MQKNKIIIFGGSAALVAALGTSGLFSNNYLNTGSGSVNRGDGNTTVGGGSGSTTIINTSPSTTVSKRPKLLGGIDLFSYCRESSSNLKKEEVRAMPDQSRSNGWLCRDYPGDPPETRTLNDKDLTDVCRKQYKNPDAVGEFADKGDRNSFECWIKS